jgi:chromosome segregation ATPase
MKFYITFLFYICIQSLLAQSPEITEEKRLMSLGERTCYKVQIPYQTASTVEKITNKYLKSQTAESVKAPKGSNEIIYKSVFLKEVKTPNFLYFMVEQQGSNVGWTGFFLNEKDSTNLENTASIQSFVQNIYKLSMVELYEDSINMQSKALKEAENNLKDLSKDAQKNDKTANKSKRQISDAEKEIAKSQENLKQTTAQLEGFTAAIKAAESQLKTAESEMGNVNQLEKTLKDLLKRDKEMNKRLKELEKDPAANANLILAQNQDLMLNKDMVKNQQQEFQAAEKIGKANLKSAEKSLDKAKDNLKEAEKTIKSENKNIQKAKDIMVEKNKEIDDSESELNRFQTKEKSEAEEKIKKEKLKLDLLKETQSLYR